MKNLYRILFFFAFITTTVISQTSWTGISNTSWTNSANWTAGIPTATTNAIIGDANFTGPNQPSISTSGAICNSLTIGTGTKTSSLTMGTNNRNLTINGNLIIGARGTLQQTKGNSVNISGDWSNSGTYLATNNNSTVVFAGTSQLLSGATTFRSMTVNASSTLTLNSNIIVTTLVIDGTLDPNEPACTVTGMSSLTVNSGGTLLVKRSTFSGNYSATTKTLAAGSIVSYAASTINQTVDNTLNYSTLIIAGSMTKSLAGNLPALNSTTSSTGNINVNSGTFDLLSYTANRGTTVAGGSVSIANGATIKIGGINSFPINYASVNLGTNSTVEYAGTAQTITPLLYYNLTNSSAGSRTFPSTGTIGISGIFTPGSSSFSVSGSTVSFNGSSSQLIPGFTFNNLTIDNTSGINLSGDVTVNGVLTMTNGIISTGMNNIFLTSSGSISGAGAGKYIYGNLRKGFSTGAQTFKFEIGDAINYTPVDLSFENITTPGDISASTIASEHSNISASPLSNVQSVNRYWTLANSGTVFSNYDATFTFVPGDVDAGANTSNFYGAQYLSSSWSLPDVGTRTSTTTKITGLTGFGDFAIGEKKTFVIAAASDASGTISPSGSVIVPYGNEQSFSITANTGYHITNVIVDGNSQGAISEFTFTNVTTAHTITANFAINTYTLTVNATNGTVTKNPNQLTYDHGTSVELTATPSTGYHFVDWTGDITGSVNPSSFAINTYTLTYTAGSNGTITGTISQTVNHSGNGTQVTAVPNTRYHFVNWSDGVTIPSRTETNVTANVSVTANFAINTYTLTYTAGSNGTITGTLSQTVSYGGNGTQVTAVPNTGYHFINWSDGMLTAARTENNVIANVSVTANFAINTYTLTYTVGSNGTITGTLSQTVNYGGNGAQVTAVPNTGYHFVNWSDGVLTAARTETNVRANVSVTANFAINTYTLTYTAGSNGTITGTISQTVNYGGNGTQVTAVPNTGYHFVNWSDGVLTAARTETNVQANVSVTANFAINTYTLTVNVTHGSVIKNPDQLSYDHGSVVQLEAQADLGYHFRDWSGDYVGTTNPVSVTMDGNKVITANFDPYQIAMQLAVANGWNLVSVPFQMENYEKTAIFPEAISTAYAYNEKYIESPVLSNGIGYWVKFSGVQTLDLGGVLQPLQIISVTQGWNLIGSISQALAVSSITSNPPGIVTSNFFGFSNGYFITDNIQPGKGYWVKADRSGELILSASGNNTSSNSIRIIPTSEQPPSAPGVNDVVPKNIPSQYALMQNYPNPFNPTSVIKYQLPVDSRVNLTIYNLLGEEIITLVDEVQNAGYQSVQWNGLNNSNIKLPSGVYIYNMTAVDIQNQKNIFSEVKKMILLK
ncbi:MAG: InlB B-repeat-containing protein [Ignavibacteriales bacterium]|nr:InlB B-repeat-containing protein [Ignavibacteriales bacterium]